MKKNEDRIGLVAGRIGLVAGNGQFPIAFLKAANTKGYAVYSVCYRNEADPEVESLSAEAKWIAHGQLSKLIDFFTSHQISTVFFLGGIDRSKIFRSFRPDFLAMKVIARAGSMRDVPILNAIRAELEHRSIAVGDPREIFSDYRCSVGVMTDRACSAAEREDARLGWKAAKMSGELDIGQTVVVSDGVIVAVEAVEGTDAAIRRAGELSSKQQVVVKVVKPQQDKRIDLPAIGVKTIETMIKADCTALILEEQGALLLEPEKVTQLANQHKIAIEVHRDGAISPVTKTHESDKQAREVATQ